MTAEQYEKAIEKAIKCGDVDALKDALQMCRALEHCDKLTVMGKAYEDEDVLDEKNFQTAHALRHMPYPGK